MIVKNDPNMKDGPFLDGSKQWAESLAYLPFPYKEGDTERQIVDNSTKTSIDQAFHPDHRLGIQPGDR